MKKDNIPGLEGYYISRLGTLWSRMRWVDDAIFPDSIKEKIEEIKNR